MTDIVWLAAHDVRPLDPTKVDAWAAGVEAAFATRLHGLRRVAAVREHVAVVVWVDDEHVPAGWQQVELTGADLAAFDGIPIGFDGLGLSRPTPIGIARAIAEDGGSARQQPPFVSVSLLEDRLTIVTDALGYASVHRAGAAGVTAWSSSPGLASLAIFGDVRPSIEGWTTQLSKSRFLGDGGPLQGVIRTAPGWSAVASDSPAPPRELQADYLTPLLAHPVPAADVATAVRSAISAVFASTRRLDLGRVRVPLSGGRDSRVLAAIALAEGLADELWTSSPPELDVQIATELVARLDTPIPWSTRNRSEGTSEWDTRAGSAGLTIDDIWATAVHNQGLAEGQDEVTPQASRRSSRRPFDGATLWGLAGEFARAYYYGEEGLRDPSSWVATFWRRARGGPGFVDPEARARLLEPRVEAIRASVRDRGVDGLRELDVFYVFERIRRFKARTGSTEVIWPYLTPPYIEATFGQPPEERVRTRYYEEVIPLALPAWAGQPYGHELKSQFPAEASNASHAAAYWASPYVEALGAEMVHRAKRDPLLVASGVRRLFDEGGTAPGNPVNRMRAANQLFGYLTYTDHLREVRTAFAEAGGAAIANGGSAALMTVAWRPSRIGRVVRRTLGFVRRALGFARRLGRDPVGALRAASARRRPRRR